jgi:hypothetical protein
LTPKVRYTYLDYSPLYSTVYSGGVENLINLQEDWRGRTLRFLGTLAIPWTAEKATKDYSPYYYKAPNRKVEYNENLRTADGRPPGTPNLLSLERKRWSRRFD